MNLSNETKVYAGCYKNALILLNYQLILKCYIIFSYYIYIVYISFKVSLKGKIFYFDI